LLSGESIERKDHRTNISPVTWFIALHSLFEEAVHRVLSKAVSDWSVATRRLSASGPVYLFDNTDYKVNPDLVVTPRKGGVLVGDIKYKNLDGTKPAEDDVYQLITHASAFRSKVAFLVYPGESFSDRVIGTTVAGLTVHVFTVSLLRFIEDIRLVAASLQRASGAP
jgi:5-methylcytosine-specific restriction endonuclease McrBC regulatory subunit McrC